MIALSLSSYMAICAGCWTAGFVTGAVREVLCSRGCARGR